jgi:two-component system, chemotaxis family, chemotaxis protein CheY
MVGREAPSFDFAERRVDWPDKDDDNALIARAKVLVVDHEYHTRKSIRSLLQAMGCRKIHEASDGGTGLAAIHALEPDVVLLDWAISGMDAAEFVRSLRSVTTHANASVPIIMMAGHRERWRVLEAVRLGVHEFLLKPASKAALKTRMLSALAKPRALKRSEPHKLAS